MSASPKPPPPLSPIRTNHPDPSPYIHQLFAKEAHWWEDHGKIVSQYNILLEAYNSIVKSYVPILPAPSSPKSSSSSSPPQEADPSVPLVLSKDDINIPHFNLPPIPSLIDSKKFWSLSHTTPPRPPPSPEPLSCVLPLFQAIISVMVASGMIQSILTVDIVFDWSIIMYLKSIDLSSSSSSVAETLKSIDPTDGNHPLFQAYAYYHSILNSNFMTLKTLFAMSLVLRASYLSFSGSRSLDKVLSKGKDEIRGPFRLGWRFRIIYGQYLFMVLAYLVFIITRYVRFMDKWALVFGRYDVWIDNEGNSDADVLLEFERYNATEDSLCEVESEQIHYQTPGFMQSVFFTLGLAPYALMVRENSTSINACLHLPPTASSDDFDFSFLREFTFSQSFPPQTTASYYPAAFQDWHTVFFARMIITALNLNVVFSTLRLLPILVQIAYFRNETGDSIERRRESIERRG